MNTHQWYLNGLRSIQPPNTFIGGVSATISTPALLATKLAIDVSRITNFSIVGSDIQCNISGSYAIPANAFNANLSITYYRDTDNLVISLGNNCFELAINLTGTINFQNVITVGNSAFDNCRKLKRIELKNATTIGDSVFSNLYDANIVSIYIPNVTYLGTTSSSSNVFLNITGVPIIYVNPSLSTNNGGLPDGDLAYAITQGATVRYVTDFTSPNSVTDLSVGTIYNTAIQLNFTAPTGSTNAIDYYECYANSVLKNNITANGQYLDNLISSINYDVAIIAVDVFYNKSVISNIDNATTDIPSLPLRGLVSYYKLDSNSNDSIGSNNGTDTSVSYVTGKIGNAGSYNGSTSKSVVGNPINLQLSKGTISCWIKTTSPGASYRSVFGKTLAYNMFLVDGVFGIYSWAGSTGFKTTGVNLADGNWHHIAFVFDSGVYLNYLYIDGVLKTTTSMTISSQGSNFDIGASGSTQYINALIDEGNVYSVKLTQADIDLLYNNGTGRTY